MSDDEPDVAEAFADPAACGLASALLLLLSVLVAVAGGRGADSAAVAVDLEFELAAPPDRFAVVFARDGQPVCRLSEGTATAGEPFGPAPAVDLFTRQGAAFRTPPKKKPAVGFTADPLRPARDQPQNGRWKAWRVGLVVEFPGRPRAVELGCDYTGDFVPLKVTARGAVQGAAGEPPAPVVHAPRGGRFRVTLAGRRLEVTD